MSVQCILSISKTLNLNRTLISLLSFVFMAQRSFDYSKWDNIELSDDESDLHPNIDKVWVLIRCKFSLGFNKGLMY